MSNLLNSAQISKSIETQVTMPQQLSSVIKNYNDDDRDDEEEEEDLDLDTELDEYTALTSIVSGESPPRNSTSEVINEQPKSSSQSPSHMLMGAITSVFGVQRSSSSLSVLSSADSSKRNMDEVQILIGNSGPEDCVSTTSSALDSFTICSASSNSHDSTMPVNYNPSRINRFIVTTTNACVDTSDCVPATVLPATAAVVSSSRRLTSSSTSDTKQAPSRQSNQNRLNEARRVHHLSRPSRIASCMSVQSMDSVASSNSSLSDYPPGTPICKFCHQRARAHDPLISPCHCKGTIRYMHCRCLMKWLEKLKKRNSRHQPLACEICNYQYRWKKKFKPTREWQLPPCLGNDRQWHTVFVICALLMLISMVNLVVFSDDPVTGYGGSPRHRGVILPSNHQYQYPAVRFPPSHIVQKVSRNGISSKAQKPSLSASPGQQQQQQSSSQIPNTTASASTSSIIEFTNSNQTDLNHPEMEAQQQINNVTLLLGNLSAAFPSLRNLIQQSVRLPANHSAFSKEGKVTMDAVSETIDTFFQQQRLKLSASRNGDTTPASESNHYLYHSNRNRALRKNTPTRPSEIILVVSGCLFFITFFLGTFAQIKSEVSFYTMVLRFIHWNQQWIIEEYDPDGTAGGSGDGSESDTESIKDFVSPSHSSAAQSVVDIQPPTLSVGGSDSSQNNTFSTQLSAPPAPSFTDEHIDLYSRSYTTNIVQLPVVCSSPKNSSVNVQVENNAQSQPQLSIASPSTIVIVTTNQPNQQPEVINL